MKILMVNKFLYYKGGAESYVLKIGEELEKSGNEVQYFGMYSVNNIKENKLNLYTSEMDFHSKSIETLKYPLKIIYSFEAKKKIKKIIEDFRPDIIHLNNINFQLTPSIIEQAYKMKVPVVQTVHDYQMICPNHLLYNKNGICEKCITGSKWNCTKYNCIHNSKIKSIIGSFEAILYTKILRTYKKVSKFICPSYFMEQKLLENKEFEEKTIVIHNFIELRELSNRQKENYVLFFGRLSEEKGLDIFIETCKKLPQIKFKVAGTGPLESELRNIENIEYVGFKTGKELEELISRAKFSVYPSIWYENCPLSILESESLGTPVITANYGGMKELVKNNKTGILVNDINVENLQKAIKELYFNNELLEEMTINCIKERENMISLQGYVKKLLKIYNDVIKDYENENSDDRS